MNARLRARAEQILQAAEDALEADGIPVPERKFIADGTIAWDCCEQLAIQPGPILRGAIGDPAGGSLDLGASIWSAQFYVWLTLPSPISESGEALHHDALHEAGLAHAEIGAALLFGITAAWRAGDFDDCTLAAISADPFGPEGGIAAWRVAVQVEI